MTAEEISNIIKDELDNESSFFNPHDVDLETSLIIPIRQTYSDSLDRSIKYQLWTVLEETPDGTGYKIFYDESENAFGLGIKSENNELVCLGIYGPFLNTLACM